MRTATIYDVAHAAEVSPATVSRVFNGQNVSPEKTLAVQKAARTLGFTPNRVAQTLRKQTSKIIALVIPDIENPYFTEIARGVEDVAWKNNHSVVLCNSDAKHEKEERYISIASSERMAGVIIAASGQHTNVSPLIDSGQAVVAVDRALMSDIDTVLIDNEQAGMMATQSLIAAGFTNIACVTGPKNIETARARVNGWRRAMLNNNLTPSEDLLVFSSFDINGGRAAAAAFHQRGDLPQAIVAGNNLLGFGIMQYLWSKNSMSPKTTVAVIGSLPFTHYESNMLTVIKLPARTVGVTAARLLFDRINGSNSASRTVTLKPAL